MSEFQTEGIMFPGDQKADHIDLINLKARVRRLENKPSWKAWGWCMAVALLSLTVGVKAILISCN